LAQRSALGRDRSKHCDSYLAHDVGGDARTPDGKQCTVVLDGRTGRQLLRVPGVPPNFVLGPRPGLMTRIDSAKRHAARYGFVTLPAG
jgi:hypothetical protein